MMVSLNMQGSFSDKGSFFPGFRRKLAHTKTQKVTEKASEDNRSTV